MRLITVAGLVFVVCGAGAQETESGRSPAVGLYGFKKQSEGGEIPPQYDLVVIHYPAFAAENRTLLEDIRQQAIAGRRVIIDFQFMTTRDQRRALAPLPPIERTHAALVALLTQLEGVPLEGITLDEENRTRPERIAYLAELYNRTKQTYPERRLLQWLSLGAPQTLKSWAPESFPADGYVIDPYLITNDRYRELADWVAKAAKPIYSVVWASPGWQVGAGRRVRASPEWWNESQWRTFYSRLSINRERGIHTIFYTYSLVDQKPAALRFGSRCEREFEQALLDLTIPRLRSGPINAVTPPERPQWIPAFCQP
jgi:hypothetical protein